MYLQLYQIEIIVDNYNRKISTADNYYKSMGRPRAIKVKSKSTELKNFIKKYINIL